RQPGEPAADPRARKYRPAGQSVRRPPRARTTDDGAKAMVSLRHLDLRIEDRGPHLWVWSCFAHYGLRALLKRPMQRDSEAVVREYGQGARHEYWKQELSPDEYIFDNHERERWILLDHQP